MINRKEIQKISLQYRTLSSQMLKMNSQEEIYCIQQYFAFITKTELIMQSVRHWQIVLDVLYDSIQAKIFHINGIYVVRQKNPLFLWYRRSVSVEVRYKSDNRFQLTFDNFDWNDYNVGSNLQNVNQFH